MRNAILKPRPNDRNIPTQHVATLLGATCCVRLATLLRHVVACWVLLAQIWPVSNLSQQQPTCCNTVAKHTQHVAPNNVVTCCVGMLRLFGRGFRCTVIWVISNHWSWPTTRTTFNGQLSFYKGPGPYMYYPRKCCGLESHWKNWLISVKQWKPMCTHTQENIPSTAYSDSELLTTV